MWFSRTSVPVGLALQGGGAHGAFTWGVLEQLAGSDALDIRALCGTSAGAVNAVAYAFGHLEGGQAGAQARLASVWRAIHELAMPEYMRWGPLARNMEVIEKFSGGALAQMAAMFSPYDFNPLDINPLRDLLSEQIDFDGLRRRGLIELFISATRLRDGQAVTFRNKDIDVDVVLASACLPNIHHAIAIGAEHYWDGGYSANPDLLTLIDAGIAPDTLLVMLNPMETNSAPRSAADIAGHINRITFNQPLIRDLATLAELRTARRGWFAPRQDRAARLTRQRLHVIEAGRHTAELPPATKARPDWDMLTALRKAGRKEAESWLESWKTNPAIQRGVDPSAFLARG